MVFTGAGNTVRPQQFPDGEAARFRELALAVGVPDAAILIEPKATNTAENLTLSRAVQTAAGVAVDTVMLIAMPYMLRRVIHVSVEIYLNVYHSASESNFAILHRSAMGDGADLGCRVEALAGSGMRRWEARTTCGRGAVC